MIRASRVLPFLLIGAAHAVDRTFTDDKGKTFATSAEKPTIVTFAHSAVSMKHYGLDAAQLLGTYGEWYNDGSDIDFEKPEMGSSFPAGECEYRIVLNMWRMQVGFASAINLTPYTCINMSNPCLFCRSNKRRDRAAGAGH
jgi:hypothetical protein